MRYVLVGFCLLSVTACTGSPTGPTTSLNTEFTLAPADVMRIDGTSLTVRFNEVFGDSRCPADALCIQGGSANVRITVQSNGSTRNYELHTGDMQPVQHEGLTVSLVQLAPYPFSSRMIGPRNIEPRSRLHRSLHRDSGGHSGVGVAGITVMFALIEGCCCGGCLSLFVFRSSLFVTKAAAASVRAAIDRPGSTSARARRAGRS